VAGAEVAGIVHWYSTKI